VKPVLQWMKKCCKTKSFFVFLHNNSNNNVYQVNGKQPWLMVEFAVYLFGLKIGYNPVGYI
jgi:hypothetical protein